MNTQREILLPMSISFVSAGLGTGLNFRLFPWLFLHFFGKGGFFYAFYTYDASMNDVNTWILGGGAISFRLFPAMSLGIEDSYHNFLGLYNDVQLTMGMNFYIKGRESKRGPAKEKVEPEYPARPQPLQGEAQAEAKGELKLVKLKFDSIFPVFFKYYDTHPIGEAVLKNEGDVATEDIEVTLLVKQYMDNPKHPETPERIEPGEKEEIDLYGLFNNNVFGISEGTKVSTLIVIEYSMKGRSFTEEHIETIRLNNRNAITWDDDRKAVASVTSKDPAVMRFAKNKVDSIVQTSDGGYMFACTIEEESIWLIKTNQNGE